MQRAHRCVVVTDAAPGAVARRAGARGFSVSHSLSTGNAGDEPSATVVRFHVPDSEAEEVLRDIAAMPGVVDAQITAVDDYPPDDEPPAGVREPRDPIPPTGHRSAEADSE